MEDKTTMQAFLKRLHVLAVNVVRNQQWEQIHNRMLILNEQNQL